MPDGFFVWVAGVRERQLQALVGCTAGSAVVFMGVKSFCTKGNCRYPTSDLPRSLTLLEIRWTATWHEPNTKISGLYQTPWVQKSKNRHDGGLFLVQKKYEQTRLHPAYTSGTSNVIQLQVHYPVGPPVGGV